MKDNTVYDGRETVLKEKIIPMIKKADELIDFLSEACQEKENKIFELTKEIDALHEKHRWRKQSEEQLPNSEDSFLVFAKGCAVMIQGRELYAPNVTNRDGIYWRPLDLPEE